MALSTQSKNYLTGSFVAGLVCTVLFGILAANSEGSGKYVLAAVACGLVAVISAIILLKNKA